MFGLVQRMFWLAVAVTAVWGFAFLSSETFGARWRTFVIEQFASRGVHLDLARLTLDPLHGLVARDVTIYNDAERKNILASVDRINLDFDYGRLLQRKFVVEAVDLSRASVTLPLDPEAPDLAGVDLKNLSARVFISEDRIDIRKAEGEISGIRLDLTGTLLLPQRPTDEASRKKDRETAMKRLEVVRERRQQIQSAIRWLERFQYRLTPVVQVHVEGRTDRLQDLNATLSFNTGPFSYETYNCEELSAEMKFNAGVVDLRRVHLEDKLGVLEANATWKPGDASVRFNLTSSADLPGLAAGFLNIDALREVVFYDSPNLAIRGEWLLAPRSPGDPPPVRALGSLQSGRFASRGEIFDSLSMDFGIVPEGFYLREGMLRHKTGSLGFQSLYHKDQGFKYRATLKMDPNAFIPFVKQDNTRELIRRFKFSENSSIFAEVEGSGPDTHLINCRTVGHGEVRSFSYRGVPFESAEADVEIQGRSQTFRHIDIRRTEGGVTADEVRVDGETKKVTLSRVEGRADAVAITGCFAPTAAEHIRRYRLPASTHVTLDGVIGWPKPDHTDFQLSFDAPDGSGRYPLWGRDYIVSRPHGKLAFKGYLMSYDIEGSVFDAPMAARGKVDLTPDQLAYDVTLSAGKFPYEVFGKNLPFEKVGARVESAKGATSFDVQSKLLGGTMTLRGAFDDPGRPEAYAGQLAIESLSFKRFAQVYSPSYESDGDLTGHFDFTGRLNDWKALKGSGVGIILNGNLYAIPVLGPLTPLLGALLPRPIAGYNVAKEANCTFKVADGFAVSEDIVALTSTFKIVSHGNINFVDDIVDLNAQARVRGLPGLVLLPVSGLLEFKGEGTVANTRWRPRFFSLPGRGKGDNREAPTAAELEAAERAGGTGRSKAEEAESENKPRSHGLLSPLIRPGR